VRLLLDTHALLWSLGRPESLSLDARRAIEDGENDVFVSPASPWEVAIKRAAGKLEATGDLADEIEAAAFVALPITTEHAILAGTLPPHHRDPFDRMLIAQARIEGLIIVSRDPRFEPYGVAILRA
jgi:PIN domain nuclease of toxin-antitoxin system